MHCLRFIFSLLMEIRRGLFISDDTKIQYPPIYSKYFGEKVQ